MFRNETEGNCFDVFKEERKEKKMEKVTSIGEAKKSQEEKEMVKRENETIKMTLQKGDIYHGTSSDGTVYFVPKCLIDALNEEVVAYVVKGGDTNCEIFNPNIDEGLAHILDFPADFYQKLSDDVLSSPVYDDSSYDMNDRWKGVRRPKTFYDSDVLENIEYMNQTMAYKVNIKPTGFYLHYDQPSPYLEKPFEAVEYIGEDNGYYYLSVARATGKEEL